MNSTSDQAARAGSFSVDSTIGAIKAAVPPKFAGWPELDNVGVRFHPKELSLIAARTGHGKTTALLNIFMNWLEAHPDQSFVFYSLELPVDAVFLKLLSLAIRRAFGATYSFYSLKDFIHDGVLPGSGGPADAETIERGISLIRDLENRMQIVYQPDWHALEFAAHARAEMVARNGSVGGLLIDYLQLMAPPPGQYERRDLEVSAAARVLKKLSVELGCPVVAAAQLTREAIGHSVIPSGRTFDALPVQEAIRHRRPQLHHLRDGGSEQEADLVLGILNYRADFVSEREDASQSDRIESGPIDVSVLKNRYGNLGVVSMVLEGEAGYIRGLGFRERLATQQTDPAVTARLTGTGE